MSAPSVYAAINAITAELATNGIAKSRINAVDDYKYRSIDDVLDRLAPLLAKHKLCVLPRAIERTVTERSGERNHLLLHVVLRVEFTLISVEDASEHIIEAYGEALDGGDKATAKAMSAAYKAAMVQTFCIPVAGEEDSDRTSQRLRRKTHIPEPPQGWRQWCLDIEDIVSLCESEQAIRTLQERNRDLLKALAREQPQRYAELGQAFVSRREVLASRACAPARSVAKRARTSEKPKAAPIRAAEVEHA